ncbi:hypothetical protein CTAM01_04377 [Colletotrichum tamarilloi]|uniref:Uncharacterized protein n=1 Tax=Colletotrichum tamarilloi TaxID=1209934 RepID=A0ABQ9RHZ4_9PEZI|nr:uncharacterized protein CTAM01_04377 [Colletotrichum tamarilloi]KAK1504147.1 hypothetical protein CTAM01_04377 [Colletotrichum tamarilloi]
MAQRALRPNLPFHAPLQTRARARISSLQLAQSTATPACVWLPVHADCSPRQSGTVDNLVRVSSLGSSIVVVGPANLTCLTNSGCSRYSKPASNCKMILGCPMR